jgi:hypothetical protein
MATDKEVLQKLLKIAHNQQKIITKLAQAAELMTPKEDITDEVNLLIGQLRSLPLGTTCVDAQFANSEKRVDAKVKLGKGQPGDPGNQLVMKTLSEAVANLKAIPATNVHIVLMFG